jgi:hypothetical protein
MACEFGILVGFSCRNSNQFVERLRDAQPSKNQADLAIRTTVRQNGRFVVLACQDTASASMPLRLPSRCCPANGAPAPCHLAVADGMLVERTTDAVEARKLWGVLRSLGLTVFSQRGAAMGDLREQCTRLQEQGQQWLKREEEFVGVLLWAVGITTLASLPDTGVFLPVHPPVFLGLKVCAAFLWLMVGEKYVQPP